MLPTLTSLNNSTQYISGELPANTIQRKNKNVQKKDFKKTLSELRDKFIRIDSVEMA